MVGQSKERLRYLHFRTDYCRSIGGKSRGGKKKTTALQAIPELEIDEEVQELAELLISKGGIPTSAEADALYVAVAAVHRIDYLLTWNCRTYR
jgi:hypothetical protein